jgi:hypothetical protein
MVYPHEAIALFRYLGARMPREQANLVRQSGASLVGERSESHQKRVIGRTL